MPSADDAGGKRVYGELAPADDAPAWMRVAHFYADKKVKEIRGGENPDIVRFFLEIRKPEFAEDEIPWCAAFVGACLFESNYGHNGSAWAAHYGIWDSGADHVDTPEYGDIVVMTRKGGGHVCFFVRDNGDGTIRCLGGNQSDSVTYTDFPKKRVTKYMRPNGNGTPKIRPNDPPGTIGREEIPGYVKPGAVEIVVGVGGGAAAISTADWLTGIVVVLIVAGIVWYIWKSRQNKPQAASQ